MTMPDPGQQMKPQDTTIFLLGEIKGTLAALQSSVSEQTRAQHDLNAENKKEHDEFRRDIADLKAGQAPRVSPWVKVSAITGIPASAGAVIALALVLTK